MKLAMIVDYSKFHDVRVDNQFATNTLVPDVVQLQTLQNFPRWNQQDRLLKYKPAGFSKIYDKFKDPQGAWMAISVLAFSYMFDVAAVGDKAPKTPKARQPRVERQDRIDVPQRRRCGSLPLQTLRGGIWLGLDREVGWSEPAVCSRLQHSRRRRQRPPKGRWDCRIGLPHYTTDKPDQVGGCRRSPVHGMGSARCDPQGSQAYRGGEAVHELAALDRAAAGLLQRLVCTD
jgi:hypothetical protein